MRSILISSLALALAAGCGSKGALVLPPPVNAPTATVPAAVDHNKSPEVAR